MDLNDLVKQSVQNKLNTGEPFTSACISHPIIRDDPSVRHRDISAEVREIWFRGELIGPDGTPYTRTNITVWPDGPGSQPTNAWLYHPDDYDPSAFKPRSRVLIRNASTSDDDNDSPVNITTTADGSTVVRQCQVQKKDMVLNLPRHLIVAAGLNPDDPLDVSVTGSTVVVKKHAGGNPNQRVDKEGRIRLHGKTVEALGTSTPVALLVAPVGADRYLQVSATAPMAPTQPAQTDSSDPAKKKGISVWG